MLDVERPLVRAYQGRQIVPVLAAGPVVGLAVVAEHPSPVACTAEMTF